MAYRVVPDRQGIIQIGKIKENLVTEVELPAPGFEGGSYAVLLQRPREKQPYPVTARAEGNALIWTVQTADTAIAGTGKLECRWYGDNGEIAKSQTYMVRITDGLPDPTEAPEAWEGFIGQVARDAQAAQTAAGEAKANADGAAASAGIAQGAAAEAEKLARAAGDAANAAAAAASSASSAQAGAETAGQNARAAAEAAETARSGAEAAKLAAGESATAAAGSAETAAQAAQRGESLYNQVKDDLAAGKLKGEKGEKGAPGKDAPQIDDSVVSADSPWSSKKIIETLCPPISESGNPVTCEPVAGYPLGVKVSWEPTQAGTGGPSPENIRPISGRDAVSVERCGGNLIKPIWKSKTESGVSYIVNDDYSITIRGTATSRTYIKFFDFRSPESLADGKYTLCTFTVLPPGTSIFAGNYNGTGFANSVAVMSPGKNYVTFAAKGVFALDAYIDIDAGATVNATFYLMLVPGSTPPTTYTPYRGDTLALALPSTVYGGSLDAVTGEGKQKWGLATFDGSEAWTIGGLAADKRDWYYVSPKIAGAINGPPKSGNEICSHYPHYDVANNNTNKGYALVWGAFRVRWGDIIPENTDAWKSYLAAQAAARTPVQVAYKLATPTPITATGNGPIMPLDGETNTVMTDADTVAVTGRADPIRIIQQLQAAQIVATQQLAETQQEVVDTAAMTVDYIYEQDSKIFGGEDNDDQTDAMPT